MGLMEGEAFDVELEAFGRVEVRRFDFNTLCDVEEQFGDLSNTNPYELARFLLAQLASKPGEEDLRNGLSGIETNVSSSELDELAFQIVQSNPWLLESVSLKAKPSSEPGVQIEIEIDEDTAKIRPDEKGAEYLLRILQAYNARISDHWTQFAKSHADSLGGLGIASAMQNAIKDHKKSITRMDGVLSSLRSPRLDLTPDHFDVSQISLPELPENPVFESNRILEKVEASVADVRGLAIEAAGMLKSLDKVTANLYGSLLTLHRDFRTLHNDFEKVSKLSTGISAVMLAVATLTLVVSVTYSSCRGSQLTDHAERIELLLQDMASQQPPESPSGAPDESSGLSGAPMRDKVSLAGEAEANDPQPDSMVTPPTPILESKSEQESPSPAHEEPGTH